MEEQEAINIYCSLVGVSPFSPQELRWNEEGSEAVHDILDAAKMVERAGGKLKSRQVVASIIVNAQQRVRDGN